VTAPTVAEIEIASIAAGGDGVGRADGMAVFVPRSAPGDVLRASLTLKGRFARGRIDEIIRPSPARTEPPCAHYVVDKCGGCQLQHMEYSAQLAAKRGIVVDSLARIAKRDVTLDAVTPSEREWRYRRKLTLAMRRTGGRWIAGLHPYDDPDGVFDLRDCPITDERVVDVWAEILRASARLPKVSRLRGSVRLLDEGASFVLEGAFEWTTSQQFFDGCPSLRELWWAPEEQRRRIVATRGDGARGGASFVQVNVAVGEALHTHVVDRVASYSPSSVVDAYSGTGTTAARTAANGATVTAIESDREAASLAAARLPAGSRSLAGRVEDLLDRALPADVIVLNPPRVGVDARVAALLQSNRSSARAIVYVSCDPATLARDLARMPAFRIARIAAFDMFPQTAHVETVCELVPEAA
jgi:23S rRNA (uracil1939-C5)-methyltransferase